MRRCLRVPMFSHFGRTPTCDRQTHTHRQTDGQTHDHGIYRASIASRGKNDVTHFELHRLLRRTCSRRKAIQLMSTYGTGNERQGRCHAFVCIHRSYSTTSALLKKVHDIDYSLTKREASRRNCRQSFRPLVCTLCVLFS